MRAQSNTRSKKRGASSPPLSTPAKKKLGRKIQEPKSSKAVEELSSDKENQPRRQDGFQVVHRKTKRRKEKQVDKTKKRQDPGKKNPDRRFKKTEVIKITAKEGVSYADLLKQVKKDVNPSKTGNEVTSVRKTRNNELIIVVKKDEKVCILAEAVSKAVGDRAAVSTLKRMKKITIRDLDETVETQDVIDEVKNALDKADSNVDIQCRLNKSYGGCQVALIRTEERIADFLSKKGKIRIGLVNCRIREARTTTRCRKCLCYGHYESRCKGPDRRDLCLKCGNKGHKVKDCKNPASCIICKTSQKPSSDHVLGTSKCYCFKEEIRRELT